ncbi:hypothetical protein C8R44DRAFT_772327 [Mycena epipterygia]|nr:hypothetical protein C8R44DRAFT_772327 [Mycena epipterygia]
MEAETELRNLAAVFYNTPDPYGQLLHRRKGLERIVSPPYKKLPRELLCEIFFFFLPATLPPNADAPLLILLQVCRAWKYLVCQSPELWASISVSFDEGVDVQRITTMADHWLARAGATYPLSVTASCTGAYATTVHDSPDLVSGFMNLVLSHAHRLRHVDLNFPIAALLPLFRLPSGSFLALETLCLQPPLSLTDMVPPETGYAQWHWPADSEALQAAPSIREIVYQPALLFTLEEVEALVPDAMERAMRGDGVGNTRHVLFAPSICLPWAQLSTITFPYSAFTLDMWYSVLNECSRLESLWLGLKVSPDEGQLASLIHLPHLNFLGISAFCGGAENLLSRLVVPKLKVFSQTGLQVSPEAFLDFQARAGFELEVIGLGFPITADGIELFLGPLSHLKWLGFIHMSTDHFPESFWDRLRHSEILPDLVEFTIRPTAAQIPYLVDIIDARWENLQFVVHFYNVRPADLPAVTEELNRLVDKYGTAEVERRVDFSII